MKFDIKRPCEHCPFRRDVPPFLNRADSIAGDLRDDHNWFACHETTGQMTGKRVKPENQSQCAGSMIVLWRSGRPNIAMRIAIITKLLKIETLEQPAPVFDSLDEFAGHHSGG